jgi:hypothetical protein
MTTAAGRGFSPGSRPWVLAALMLLAATSMRGAVDNRLDIAIAARANAYPSVTADGSLVALAWGATTVEAATDVYTAVSRDGGRSFAAPVRVSATPANLSGEQPPAIALVPRAGQEPSVVVVWTSKSPEGTKLVSSRSDDGGRTFGAAVPVPGSEAAGNRGWESITTDRDGHVVAVWLDHRELASSGHSMAMGANHEHAMGAEGKTDAVARAQRSKILFGRIDGEVGAEPIAGGVCYCCKTALAAGANGGIYAAWRQVYAGNIRDIAFARSMDGRTFAPPARVSEDNWMLDGCPENGPSLAVDARDRVHVVWPTLLPAADSTSEPTLALFYAMSADGRTFTPRARIPTAGVARHPQVALGSRDELFIVWDEQDGGTRRVAAARARVAASDPVTFVRQPFADAGPAGYPVVAGVADADVVAWTSGSGASSTIRLTRVAR